MRISFFHAAMTAIVFLSGACVQDYGSSTTEVLVHQSPREDKFYFAAFKAATRSVRAYENFETKYIVHITYFSPAFRVAFQKRLQTLLDQSQPFFNETANKTGFFVSIYGPEANKIDLNNEDLWTIALELQNNKLPPLQVDQLAKKERWEPFFSYVNPWSREYFILFETTAPSAPTPLKLSLTNADARVSMTWP